MYMLKKIGGGGLVSFGVFDKESKSGKKIWVVRGGVGGGVSYNF